MMTEILPLVREFLQAVGLEGISAIGLVALLSVALYTHRAAAVGGTVVGTAATVGHDIKVVSVTLAILLVLGVIAVNPARAMELFHSAGAWVGQEIGRLVP